MKVLKFGGSSLATPENILKVKNIVESDGEAKFVVVSALGGVTNDLIAATTLAARGDQAFLAMVEEIKVRHLDAVKVLVPAHHQLAACEQIEQLISKLASYLEAVSFLGEATPKARAYLVSFGERLSSFIVSLVIEDATLVDVRELIKTTQSHEKGQVDFVTTQLNCQKVLLKSTGRVVLAGFIASNEKGETTTLGRGGSDYTASIIGAGVGADSVEIWTDVDGFLTADPRKVKKAYPIEHLSFAEVFELACFGANVLYPPAVKPLYDAGIEMFIKNTLNEKAAGTRITAENCPSAGIKGISSIDDVLLLTLHGVGVASTAGILKRLFTALADADVSVILISQVSSEQSITFAIAPDDQEEAERAITENFKFEMMQETVVLKVETEMSAIAVIGENMRAVPGVAGRFFGSLGKNGINVVSIAQGSSELNISAVVKKSDLRKALNVVHEIFFLANHKKIHIYLAGIGTVGSRLVAQLEAQHQTLLANHGLELSLVGVMNSKAMLFDAEGIGFTDLKEKLASDGEPLDVQGFASRILEINFRNSVFIDVTANEGVASLYEGLLKNYVSVITANKIATSDTYERFKKLQKLSSVRGVKFLYETNVGAGLPVIHTLEDLILSGDKVTKIEAVLSGTLNFIFNTLSADIPLSEIIKMARDEGYAEPDPRIDLSGVDVMRKILILARVAGYQLESDEVAVETFLPDVCFEAPSIEAFFDEVKKIDGDFEAKRAKLDEAGKKWRFVATFENQKASVNLIEVDSEHPFYQLQGTDNVVTIYTERYHAQPLIIKGAGAGSEVTAMGVFGDLIRLANL
ncbi:MAG: bifunctional aspartate kinase/homoserine dehydrogenase I [Defluviitaleaceae bacterium]|nr:bifunctional aspartate kinase/homoserine dehydrogenase I [Defluviitaleaceae bacterium]